MQLEGVEQRNDVWALCFRKPPTMAPAGGAHGTGRWVGI